MADLEVVAVLRQCRRCGEWKPIGKFNSRNISSRVCADCAGHWSPVRSRAIVITPLGHADLERWRAEEAAAVA